MYLNIGTFYTRFWVQVPEEQDNSYEEDSFCVGSEENGEYVPSFVLENDETHSYF